MRVKYNAPVVLTFTLLCLAVHSADRLIFWDITRRFFAVGTTMQVSNPVDWWRLFGHVLGHDGLAHLVGNMTFLLLLGPGLEEKYGSLSLLEMILLTAGITGVVTVLFLPAGLMGASGVVFMMILLSSFVNVRGGEIPLTFLLVAILFLGQEFAAAFRDDNISQAAHLLGGACGGAFGLLNMHKK
jgi:membrane associated rhomboid family serine protease